MKLLRVKLEEELNKFRTDFVRTRELMGFSRQDVAYYLELSLSTVRNFEKGETMVNRSLDELQWLLAEWRRQIWQAKRDVEKRSGRLVLPNLRLANAAKRGDLQDFRKNAGYPTLASMSN